MSSQNTTNSANVIRQQVYSDLLQTSFQDNLLGMALFYDMTSMFPDGDTFNVDQIGDIALQDYTEDSVVDYTAVDTSRITLSVSEYKSDAFSMSDKLQQDSNKAARLFAERIKKSLYQFNKQLEADIYAACNDVQTAASLNTINGQPHRSALAGAATAQNVVDRIADIKLSFDKANIPEVGRIMIVDSTVENVLNKLGSGAVLVADSPRFEGLLETGFARDHRFVRNIHGFDIYVSNLLPRIASETVDGVAVTSGICNIAMCVADDDCKPVMGVIRQRPAPEGPMRDPFKPQDNWRAFGRWGFATYRPESVYCLLTQF